MQNINNIEIIIYEYNFFLSIKNCIIDDTDNNFINKIKNKLNQLFDYNYRTSYTKKVVSFYNNYNNNIQKTLKEKNFTRKNKDKKVEIFGLLNKITEINYDNILQEIKNILYQDKSIFLYSIDDLWDFCYKQSIYSIIYVDLLNNIILFINDENINKLIIQKLTKKINDFISEELLNNINSEIITNYNDFCDNNIKYKNTRGKIITICWIIIRTNLNIITSNELFANLRHLNLHNDISIDLLHIYNTLIHLDTKYILYLKNFIETNIITKKNKYKIMDIIDNRNYQLDGFKIIKPLDI